MAKATKAKEGFRNIFVLSFLASTFLPLFLFILSLPLSSAAVDEFGPYELNTCITITKLCANCTYNNITSIKDPDTLKSLGVKPMTKVGTEYNYSNFCGINKTGNYIVNGLGDPNGSPTDWQQELKVTPTGDEGILGLSIIILFVAFFLPFLGLFLQNKEITILGGFALMIIGLYSYNDGIDIYLNRLTEVFSIIMIGLGAMFALYSAMELIRENT